jgi:hypothetical protein
LPPPFLLFSLFFNSYNLIFVFISSSPILLLCSSSHLLLLFFSSSHPLLLLFSSSSPSLLQLFSSSSFHSPSCPDTQIVHQTTNTVFLLNIQPVLYLVFAIINWTFLLLKLMCTIKFFYSFPNYNLQKKEKRKKCGQYTFQLILALWR